MNELTNLLTVFGNIPIDNKKLLLAFIIVIGILVYKFLDDRKHIKYYEDMKSEKNKEINQLEWIKLMNNYKNTAEEMILKELIYTENM